MADLFSSGADSRGGAEEALMRFRHILPVGAIDDDPNVLQDLRSDRSRFKAPFTPMALLMPSSVEQVSSIVKVAGELGIAIFTRGKGSGVVGGALPTSSGGIVLSTERLDQMGQVNEVDHTLRVGAGVLTSRINEAVAPYGLFYAPDPASSGISSIGGNIATNAGGFHCVKYGVTRESLLSLEVVLSDGSVIETGRNTVKNVAGLDLTSLFTGSEGTLGIVTAATLRLRPRPSDVATAVAFFKHIADVGKGVQALARSGVQPSVCELLAVPERIVQNDRYAKLSRNASWMLMMQTDGSGAQTDIERLLKALHGIDVPAAQATGEDADWVFSLRTRGKPHPKDSWRATGDVAVPVSQLANYLDQMEKIALRHGYRYTLVAHVGDGNIHSGFFASKAEYSEYPEGLVEAHRELMDTALALGGTITGEHGIGIELDDFLEDQIGLPDLRVQKAIKRALDPAMIFNPGKWL